MPESIESEVAYLLNSTTEIWAEYDPDAVSALRQQALGLLVAAGLVERRSRLCLRMFDQPQAIEFTVTTTGEAGIQEAYTRVAAAMYGKWGKAWAERKKGPAGNDPSFNCERIGPTSKRLTPNGIEARRAIGDGQSEMIFAYVLKRGFFDGTRWKMPDGSISQRTPVRGSGSIEQVKIVAADASPGMRVVNWQEGARVFADAFGGKKQQIEGAPGAEAGQTPSKPGKTREVPKAPDGPKSDEKSNGATSRRGRLNKADSEIKHTEMLAKLRQHPTLKDEPARLAVNIGVSESTVRRWLAEDDKKYRESQAKDDEAA